jgi:hypothetical protein
VRDDEGQAGDDDGYPTPEEMRENNPGVRFGFSSGVHYHNEDITDCGDDDKP